MKLLIKKNWKVFFFVVGLSAILVFSCTDPYFYHISNQSSKDIKVLYISYYKQKSDTLKRLILEPGTSFLIDETSHGIPWHYKNDTVYHGMDLIITQDSIKTTKDHRKQSNWESDKNKNLTFTVRDEDF